MPARLSAVTFSSSEDARKRQTVLSISFRRAIHGLRTGPVFMRAGSGSISPASSMSRAASSVFTVSAFRPDNTEPNTAIAATAARDAKTTMRVCFFRGCLSAIFIPGFSLPHACRTDCPRMLSCIISQPEAAENPKNAVRRAAAPKRSRRAGAAEPGFSGSFRLNAGKNAAPVKDIQQRTAGSARGSVPGPGEPEKTGKPRRTASAAQENTV